MKTALVWTTILILTLGLHLQRGAKEAAEAAAAESANRSARAAYGAAWLGHRVPGPLRSLLPTEISERLRLVWIVSPDRCPNCLKTPRAWNELLSSGDISLHIVSAGANQRALDVQALDPRARLFRLERDLLLQDFGEEWESLRLVMDRADRIIAVDSRRTDRSCEWSFEAVVAALAGLDINIPFRPAPANTLQNSLAAGYPAGEQEALPPMAVSSQGR